jgi:hypothetical protein
MLAEPASSGAHQARDHGEWHMPELMTAAGSMSTGPTER